MTERVHELGRFMMRWRIYVALYDDADSKCVNAPSRCKNIYRERGYDYLNKKIGDSITRGSPYKTFNAEDCVDPFYDAYHHVSAIRRIVDRWKLYEAVWNWVCENVQDQYMRSADYEAKIVGEFRKRFVAEVLAYYEEHPHQPTVVDGDTSEEEEEEEEVPPPPVYTPPTPKKGKTQKSKKKEKEEEDMKALEDALKDVKLENAAVRKVLSGILQNPSVANLKQLKDIVAGMNDNYENLYEIGALDPMMVIRHSGIMQIAIETPTLENMVYLGHLFIQLKCKSGLFLNSSEVTAKMDYRKFIKSVEKLKKPCAFIGAWAAMISTFNDNVHYGSAFIDSIHEINVFLTQYQTLAVFENLFSEIKDRSKDLPKKVIKECEAWRTEPSDLVFIWGMRCDVVNTEQSRIDRFKSICGKCCLANDFSDLYEICADNPVAILSWSGIAQYVFDHPTEEGFTYLSALAFNCPHSVVSNGLFINPLVELTDESVLRFIEFARKTIDYGAIVAVSLFVLILRDNDRYKDQCAEKFRFEAFPRPEIGAFLKKKITEFTTRA